MFSSRAWQAQDGTELQRGGFDTNRRKCKVLSWIAPRSLAVAKTRCYASVNVNRVLAMPTQKCFSLMRIPPALPL